MPGNFSVNFLNARCSWPLFGAHVHGALFSTTFMMPISHFSGAICQSPFAWRPPRHHFRGARFSFKRGSFSGPMHIVPSSVSPLSAHFSLRILGVTNRPSCSVAVAWCSPLPHFLLPISRAEHMVPSMIRIRCVPLFYVLSFFDRRPCFGWHFLAA